MIAPKLRFSEFKDEWQISKLKDVCKINQGLQIAISERFLENGENRYFYITNEFLKEGSKKNYFIENPPKSVICNETDILMTRTGNTGQVVTDVDGAFHNNFFKIDYSREVINKGFFVEFLRKESTQNLILKYAGASTIPDLNHSDFYKIEMIYPNLKEQTKIAEFLSAVDDKISQLSRQLELLNQYKKGVMQKIFSQEIRFKNNNGEDFGEWDEKSLDEITEVVGGGTPSTSNQEYWDGEIVWLTPSEINRKYISKSKRTISIEGVNNSSAKILPKGTVLFTSRATIGEVAIAQNEVTTNQGFQSFIVKTDILNEFLYYWLIFNKNLFLERASGSTFLEVSKNSIKLITISLPPFLEQQKIAEFLTAIDERIDHTTAQLTHTKQWKKGLLQQMFV